MFLQPNMLVQKNGEYCIGVFFLAVVVACCSTRAMGCISHNISLVFANKVLFVGLYGSK
jgi:hypothetical protein